MEKTTKTSATPPRQQTGQLDWRMELIERRRQRAYERAVALLRSGKARCLHCSTDLTPENGRISDHTSSYYPVCKVACPPEERRQKAKPVRQRRGGWW